MTAATREKPAAPASARAAPDPRLVPPVAPLPFVYLLRNLVGWLFILLTCVSLGPLVVPLMVVLFPFGKAPVFGDWLIAWWLGVLRRLWGVRIVVDGLEHVRPGQPYVLVANHRSHLDPPSCILGLRPRMRFGFVMKRSLSLIPLWGWFIWLNGFVPIDRGGRARGKDQLEVPARYVRNGRSVMIFPEGHRAPDHRFLQFKKGAVVLALRAGVPLLPVVCSGTAQLWPKRSWFIRPGAVRVEVLPPIPTEGLGADARERLLDALKDAIAGRYRLDVDGPPASSDAALLAALTGSIGRRERPEI